MKKIVDFITEPALNDICVLHLDTDVANYGRRYKANPDSRWNTPEFAALAAAV